MKLFLNWKQLIAGGYWKQYIAAAATYCFKLQTAARMMEDRVYGFYRRGGSRFLPILLISVRMGRWRRLVVTKLSIKRSATGKR